MNYQINLSRKVCAQLDWKEVYADFKRQNCSLKDYREGAFVEFLKRHEITSCVPCERTLCRHFKSISEQEKAEANATEDSESNTNTEFAASDDRDVKVLVLDEINESSLSSLTHRKGRRLKANTGITRQSSLSPSYPQKPISSGHSSIGISTTLETRWHGMIIKIPCTNPEESLARLLMKLQAFEETSNEAKL